MKEISDIDFKSGYVYWYMNKYIQKIQVMVSKYVGESIVNLRFCDYLKFAQNNINNFMLDTFPIQSSYLSDHFAGMLIVKEDVKIYINTTYTVEKQHQTFFHELVHFYRHALTNSDRKQTFSELVNLNSYPFDDRLRESEANYGASFLLLPSYVIDQCISYNFCWDEVLKEFEVSTNDLSQRLLDFLIFENGQDVTRAKELVEEVKQDGFGKLARVENGWREKYMCLPVVSYDYIACSMNRFIADQEKRRYLMKVNGEIDLNLF